MDSQTWILSFQALHIVLLHAQVFSDRCETIEKPQLTAELYSHFVRQVHELWLNTTAWRVVATALTHGSKGHDQWLQLTCFYLNQWLLPDGCTNRSFILARIDMW